MILLAFEEAYRIRPDPVFLFNIAQAYRLSEKYEEALHFYRTYLRAAPKASNKKDVDARIEELQALVRAQKSVSAAPPQGPLTPTGAADKPPSDKAPVQPAAPKEPPPAPPPLAAQPVVSQPEPVAPLPTVAAPARPVRERRTKFARTVVLGALTPTDGGVDLPPVDTMCTQGIDRLLVPKIGSEAQLQSALSSVEPGGLSNVGEAVEQVFLDGAMHDPRRAPGHIVLITDGAANCDPREISSSDATRLPVQAVARAGMKVLVLAPGLDSQTLADLDVYASVGGAPCAGPLCGGHAAWPAGSPQDVTDMLDAILTRIESENVGCVPSLPASVMCASASGTQPPWDMTVVDL